MKMAKLLLLISLLVLISSCENPFRPHLRDASSSVVQNRSPEELLRNLEKAYGEKNIKLFQLLLHKEYRFELLSSEVSQIGMDMDGDGIRDAWWDYEREIELTRNMFERGSSDGNMPVADQIELILRIPPQENWELDPADGHENWIIIPCPFDLILSFNSSNSSYVASGIARFYLVQEGGRWYIMIWRDESYL